MEQGLEWAWRGRVPGIWSNRDCSGEGGHFCWVMEEWGLEWGWNGKGLVIWRSREGRGKEGAWSVGGWVVHVGPWAQFSNWMEAISVRRIVGPGSHGECSMAWNGSAGEWSIVRVVHVGLRAQFSNLAAFWQSVRSGPLFSLQKMASF